LILPTYPLFHMESTMAPHNLQFYLIFSKKSSFIKTSVYVLPKIQKATLSKEKLYVKF
jgi:hypothetical protein